MYAIFSQSLDPAFNLALEQLVFESFDPNYEYLLLYRNSESVILGKHQNVWSEVSSNFLYHHPKQVFRRCSGGGTVYHDPGNLNYSFILHNYDSANLDKTKLSLPIVKALAKLGIPTKINERNDLVIANKKISGTAQYLRRKRILHHGTLLYATNLNKLRQALQVDKYSVVSKAIKSIPSPVINIQDTLAQPFSMQEFMEKISIALTSICSLEIYNLTAETTAQVQALKTKTYANWAWNYAESPPCHIYRTWANGNIIIHIQAGLIQCIEFYGENHSQAHNLAINSLETNSLQLKSPHADSQETSRIYAALAQALQNCPFEFESIYTSIENIDFRGLNINNQGFTNVLMNIY